VYVISCHWCTFDRRDILTFYNTYAKIFKTFWKFEDLLSLTNVINPDGRGLNSSELHFETLILKTLKLIPFELIDENSAFYLQYLIELNSRKYSQAHFVNNFAPMLLN